MLNFAYYKMQEIKRLKSKRLDCVASTGEYPPFEAIAKKAKNGRFHFYLTGIPENFSAEAVRRADMAIIKTRNISSLYIPDPLNHPYVGYGDYSDDALLFILSQDLREMEILVVEGQKHNSKALWTCLANGDLNGEISRLRREAVPQEEEAVATC